MVTATVAEATAYGVNIKGPGGQTVKVGRARLADASRPHGINLDEADEEVERLGYVAGVWRWQDAGYYKAVVAPHRSAEPWQPKSGEAGARLAGQRPASYGKRRLGGLVRAGGAGRADGAAGRGAGRAAAAAQMAAGKGGWRGWGTG